MVLQHDRGNEYAMRYKLVQYLISFSFEYYFFQAVSFLSVLWYIGGAVEGSQATKVGCREELLWISRFLVWLLTLRTLR